MGKVSILLGIHAITRRKVQKRRSGRDGSKHVKGKINHQLQKSTTWARIFSDRTVFCILRGGRKMAGLMPLGLFLLSSPAKPDSKTFG